MIARPPADVVGLRSTAAALKCAVQDQWISGRPAVVWQRLHLVANNVGFLI